MIYTNTGKKNILTHVLYICMSCTMSLDTRFAEVVLQNIMLHSSTGMFNFKICLTC